MNRGGVTKRQLDRDILGKRGDRRYRTTLRHRPTLRSSLGFLSLYTVLLRLLRPLTVLSLSLFLALFYLHPLSPSTFLSFSLAYTHIHTHISLSFPFSLLSTVLPRCLTPFSLQESCGDLCIRFARYRERIKYPFASDDLTPLRRCTLHHLRCTVFIAGAYGRTLFIFVLVREFSSITRCVC